jgi:Beta-xylosidase
MNTINFEQVKYEASGDVKPIITNLIYTYPHWHNELEIVFACKGDLNLSMGAEQHRLQQGEIALFNSMEIHAINSVLGSEDGAYAEKSGSIAFLLQISGRFMRSLHLDIESLRFARYVEEPETAGELRRLLLLIMEEVESPRALSAGVIHGYSGAAVATLLRSCVLADLEKEGHRDAPRHASLENERNLERLKRVLSWINEHYAENPSLGDAAAAAFISPYYLSHFFTAALGMSYSHYLNNVKVDMARQELLASTDSVVDVMLRHGFPNAKTFNRVFKEALGCSPSQYRKAAAPASLGRSVDHSLPPSKTEMGSYINFQERIKIPTALYRDEQAETLMPDSIVDREVSVGGTRIAKLDRYFFKMLAVARASDLLRARVREQLSLARKELGFEYLRFHGIFDDEMGILHPAGQRTYNFTLIDEILDFMLSLGIRPFLELSFMPTAIASGDKTVFFYRGNATPPRDWALWEALMTAFMEHLVGRYTLPEIRLWYFEVWNEPNLADFWTGSFEDYLRLYAISAQVIKGIDPAIPVGGPAISSFQFSEAKAYLERFMAACAERGLPLDFVSGHPYPVWYYRQGDEIAAEIRGPDQTREDMIWIRDAVHASAYPEAEIHLDEWNTSSDCHDLIHDTAFMAPFILRNYLSGQGLAQSLCYWALSDLFEEGGVPEREFHGGFGLFNKASLQKPQYHAFAALRRLGEELLAQGEDYIVTRDAAGSFQALAWNYLHYERGYADGDKSALDYYERYEVFERGERRLFRFSLPKHEPCDWLVEKMSFDREHGSVFDSWLKNGAIENLTPEQSELLRSQCQPKRELSIFKDRQELVLEAAVEPHGFVLIVARPLDRNN